MNFVACAAWVARGVADSSPQKVSLSKDELKQILEENKAQLRDLEDEAIALLEEEEESNNFSHHLHERAEEQIIADYHLDTYDDDDAPSTNALAGLANLVCFASNDDDEYMTLKDEDNKSDKSDDIIHPDDNLIAVGHAGDDYNTLEIYVFNQESKNLYVYQDMMLQSAPLCLEWMDFDPLEKGQFRSNLVAIGTVSPVIEIWDLNLVNSLEPVFKLDKKKKKKQKGTLGHTDAILGLSWNKIIRTILASGSADQTVALWDLTEGKVISSISDYADKVQTLEWHPFEAQTLLTGCCDKSVKINDCRDLNNVVKTWSLEGEIECLAWDHFNPFCCFASTERGFVYQLDSRSSNPTWTMSAHFEACTGLQLSCHCPGLLVTASTDKTIKVWDVDASTCTFVAEKKTQVGKIMCLQSCPDAPFVFCVGGDNRSNCFAVQDISTLSAVANHFATRSLLFPFATSEASLQSEEATTKGLAEDEVIQSGRKQKKHSVEKRKQKKKNVNVNK